MFDAGIPRDMVVDRRHRDLRCSAHMDLAYMNSKEDTPAGLQRMGHKPALDSMDRGAKHSGEDHSRGRNGDLFSVRGHDLCRDLDLSRHSHCNCPHHRSDPPGLSPAPPLLHLLLLLLEQPFFSGDDDDTRERFSEER